MSPRDIAVICAENVRGHNRGMYSVELAAASYFRRRGRRFDLYVADGRERTGVLGFRTFAAPEQLRDYRAVVYWGDFQNNPMWGRDDLTRRLLSRRVVRTPEEAIDYYVSRHLDLGPAVPDSTRVYSVGQSMLGAQEALGDGTDYVTRTLQEGMAAFLRRVERVIVRDSPSYDWLRERTPLKVEQGVDCAFLQEVSYAPKEKHFVYAFGRTLSRDRGGRLAEAVARLTGLRAAPVAWLGRPPRWRRAASHFKSMTALIASARFVLTDIYHLSINAMVRRTPALCLSSGDTRMASTRSDAKKLALFRMYDAERLLYCTDCAVCDDVEDMARWVVSACESLDQERLWAACEEKAARMRRRLDVILSN